MNLYKHEVQYYECDGMRITHHSNYIRFMEEARVDWLDKLGYGFDRMESEGVSSPIVSVQCNYRKPTKFKDIIEISVRLLSLSKLKMEIGYEMRVRGELVCSASSTHCFFYEGKPVVIEERFPSLVEGMKEN